MELSPCTPKSFSAAKEEANGPEKLQKESFFLRRGGDEDEDGHDQGHDRHHLHFHLARAVFLEGHGLLAWYYKIGVPHTKMGKIALA